MRSKMVLCLLAAAMDEDMRRSALTRDDLLEQLAPIKQAEKEWRETVRPAAVIKPAPVVKPRRRSTVQAALDEMALWLSGERVSGDEEDDAEEDEEDEDEEDEDEETGSCCPCCLPKRRSTQPKAGAGSGGRATSTKPAGPSETYEVIDTATGDPVVPSPDGRAQEQEREEPRMSHGSSMVDVSIVLGGSMEDAPGRPSGIQQNAPPPPPLPAAFAVEPQGSQRAATNKTTFI